MEKFQEEDADDRVLEKLYGEINSQKYNENEYEKASSQKTNETIEYKVLLPQTLLKFMYLTDLSILCLLRKCMYNHKYSSLSLVLEKSKTSKFNNIVLQYDEKSTVVQVEYVDEYLTDNKISYDGLLRRKKYSTSLHDYFDNFLNYLISKQCNKYCFVEYFVVYTNSELDLTDKKKFQILHPSKSNVLRRFLLANKSDHNAVFYSFSQDEKTKEELLNHLKFSPCSQKIIDKHNFSKDCLIEMKESFIGNLVFAINQPSREELNSFVKNEIIKQDTIQDDYMMLLDKMSHKLTSQQNCDKFRDCLTENLYTFNLLIAYMHFMYMDKKMYSINLISKNNDFLNDIVINYKGKIIYLKVHTANSSISYQQLFPVKKALNRNKFSVNEQFNFYVKELESNIRYLIIYADAGIKLTRDNTLEKRNSRYNTDLNSLKLDKINGLKKKIKGLRNYLHLEEDGLYQFSKETTEDKLLDLLQLPSGFETENEDGIVNGEDAANIKRKFLQKLVFAFNQRNLIRLNNVIRDDIIKKHKTGTVPYSYAELHEVALRWSEAHEYGPITRNIIIKLLNDIKDDRFSFQKSKAKDISEEIRFTRSIVGTGEESYFFQQFLGFLIKGDGKRYLEVLREKKFNLTTVSGILNKSGSQAMKAFKELFTVWFDDQDNATEYLTNLTKHGISLSNISGMLGGSGIHVAKTYKNIYNLWFDDSGQKKFYLKVLEKHGMNISLITGILNKAGYRAPRTFVDLFNLWFDENGNKSQYLKTLEAVGVTITNMSVPLNTAGAHAPKAFKDLYNIWLDEEGNKRPCLVTLERENVNLTNLSSVIAGSGSNAAKSFENLYDLLFDEKGNKKKYLKTLEKNNMDLSTLSSILSGTGANASKAFKDLYDIFFDEQGNRSRYLKNFTDNNDGNNFSLTNLSSILNRSRLRAKDGFERLHNICFDTNGKRTNILTDFYNAGFKPSNLATALYATGIRASHVVKKLHDICFDEKGDKTKFLDDFYSIGFSPANICSLMSGAIDDLEKFYDYCFVGESKKYLQHFVNGGFKPKHLSKVLLGARSSACQTFKDFHDVCFDEDGNRTQILKDFYAAGFKPRNLFYILSIAGRNAATILRHFHEQCFNERNYLEHFLAEKELFTPKDISMLLYGVGMKISSVFRKLHNICFDKSGKRTDYLHTLIINYSRREILDDKLYHLIRRAYIPAQSSRMRGLNSRKRKNGENNETVNKISKQSE